MNDLTVKSETLDDLERQIGEIIKSEHMTPDRVAATIGDHAKALIRHATAQARQGMTELFEEMQAMDTHIAEKERFLCAEADKLIAQGNNARQTAVMLRTTIEGWRNPPKTNGGA